MAEIIANMDDHRLRTRIVNAIASKRGMWRIDVTQYRPRRSDRQNRFYWPCCVQPFAAYLREQGEPYTDTEAHEILKHKFLRKTVKVKGERLDITRSTTELDTAEFNEYMDNVAAWLADMFGFVMPDPSDYHERDAQS